MSYLHLPRLIFSGQFQADVSTVNNDPSHFNTAKFRSNYQLPGPGASNGWWNPGGTGAWRFRGCTVTRVYYPDGTSCDDPSTDPIVGAPINGGESHVEGKLVDLDSEQQMVSEIWGFRVNVGHPGAGTAAGTAAGAGWGFRSEFAVAPFGDIWTRFAAGQPDSFFGAYYQSILQAIAWAGPGKSAFLRHLADVLGPGKALSIKFNVDGFDDTMTSPTFTFGRVVGAIGPIAVERAEPKHFVAARRLSPVQPQPLANPAPAVVVGRTLTIDLGNSLATSSVGGPPVDQGPLWAAMFPAGRAPVLLGEIHYREPGWYERTAGIVAVSLSADQATAVASAPIGVVQATGAWQQSPPFLSEAPDGSWMRADGFVFRFNPGEELSTRFYATRFGAPYAGAQITLLYDPTIVDSFINQGVPISGPADLGSPKAALRGAQGGDSFHELDPLTITTGADGVATLTMQGRDPGNPRGYIDGQVYGIAYQLGATPPVVGAQQNPSMILNALVFSGYEVPAHPTWMRDVRPIFAQYANLYPIMRPIVNLADFASIMGRRKLLQNVFATPVTDPNYMPVTRDLSTAKRTMLQTWLANPVYMALDSAENLMAALQQAIELEHATIPPYLCALYSLKQGTNLGVAKLIRGIVMEEMLHMAIAANLLISVGGHPAIAYPGFVPNYPGPLPAGLHGGLLVSLRKCSIAQIRDVFMVIEEPGIAAEPVHGSAAPGDPRDVSRYTIGWFYDEIERSLEALAAGGQIHFGHTDKQVPASAWSGPGELFVIDSLATARRAIREIKRQGEGTTPFRPGDGDGELAHYYKFSEIVAGRRIVRGKDGFTYDGEPIPFAPDGVWPMMDDPDLAKLPPGSRAAILTEQFARIYQTLLRALERAFTGEPDYLRQSIGIMYSLDLAARELMQTPSGLGDGTTAGPAFQLPFPE
jgi:Ferritin-like